MLQEASDVLARCRHEIQVAIQRRRAAMTRAVLPKLGAAALWLVAGDAAGVPSSDRRAPPLHDGIEEEQQELDDALEDLGAESSEDVAMEGSAGAPR